MITPEAVYILANRPQGMLYVGRTRDLLRRCWQHRAKALPGYTAKYGIDQLVYYEWHQSWEDAATRERRIKRWRRAWKFNLIEEMNPGWKDLWFEIAGKDALDDPDLPPFYNMPTSPG